MLRASDRGYSRRDTWLFVACVALSVTALFLPSSWGLGIAEGLRSTVLRPVIWLQRQAEEGRTSRARLRAVTAQRDSTAVLAQSLPVLLAENERLRQALALSRRLSARYVAAEVLHQPQATDGRMILVDVGSNDGVEPFDPVVAPEGLIGVISSVGRSSSVAMTWAHPEFRVSAFTADGRVSGMVAPSPSGISSETALEFRAITYRDTVTRGTMVLSSGLGGVYPKGIPLGTVVGVEREQVGWERIYRLHPAANPGVASHVLVLTGDQRSPVAAAFPSESLVAAQRGDSIRRALLRDSTIRVQAESLAVLRSRLADTTRRAATPPPRVPAPKPAAPKPAAPQPAAPPAPGDSTP